MNTSPGVAAVSVCRFCGNSFWLPLLLLLPPPAGSGEEDQGNGQSQSHQAHYPALEDVLAGTLRTPAAPADLIDVGLTARVSVNAKPTAFADGFKRISNLGQTGSMWTHT